MYSAILTADEVVEASVVDVQSPGGDARVPLFVAPAPGVELDDDLRRRLARRIREDCSPRHVLNDVFAVPEIPRTLSGQGLEVPVKRILNGTPPEQAASRGSLANPDALDWFVAFAQEHARPRASL